jgi:hypothetical protein
VQVVDLQDAGDLVERRLTADRIALRHSTNALRPAGPDAGTVVHVAGHAVILFIWPTAR